MSWCEVISKYDKKARFSLYQGQSVGELVAQVAQKFHYTPGSVRLFYSGKELQPGTSLIEDFEIGKYGNFLLHLSTTTVEILEDSQPLSSVGETFDLTRSEIQQVLVDLTDSPQLGRRKRTRSNSSQAACSEDDSCRLDDHPSSKQLRINILRALNHRLCILENEVVHPYNSDGTLISVRFIIQDSGVGNQYHVRIGPDISCNCESNKRYPCTHILFILIKVFKISDRSSLFRDPLMFTAAELTEMFQSKGYFNSEDTGVIYCGTKTPHTMAAPQNHVIAQGSTSPIPHEPECCICLRTLVIPLESFEDGDELVSCQKCTNKIHLYCLRQWQERSETCPNCRSVWMRSGKKIKRVKK